MKWITHWAVVALGIATLCTLFVTGPLISLSHEGVYHLEGPAASLFLPVALNVGLLWLALASALWMAERRRWIQIAVWCGMFCLLPVLLFKNWSALVGTRLSTGAIAATTLAPLLAGLAAVVLRRGDLGRTFDHAQDFAATMLGFCSLVGLVVIVQLSWFGWLARGLNAARPLLAPSGVVLDRAAHPRVIWILLDELSYRQIYEVRFPGLRLPAFDALAATATVFTQVVPSGNKTDLVIPSLMTGIEVDRLRLGADGSLLRIHEAATGTWRAFDPRQTVFQDALDAGGRTGVAGWYIPYCRILSEVLDRCFWSYRNPYPGHIEPDWPLWANVASPFQSLVVSAWRRVRSLPPLPPFDVDRSKLHIADYQELTANGDALLADASLDFTLVHLPIPHPGGIFDHRRRRMTTINSSYVDNLALADEYIAHVRDLLERSGQWDGSAVVVMGDHSWRSNMWAHSADWTAEDEAASQGERFDPRPAYIVKLPGEQEGTRIDATFEAVRTRALMDALLANRLKSVGDLRDWVGR